MALVITNFYFVGVFIDFTRERFVVGLFSFRYDVERVADLDPQVFIFRCVLNAIFADELLRAVFILLVKPNRAGGQSHAQLVVRGIAKLHEDANLLFDYGTWTVIATVVVALTV